MTLSEFVSQHENCAVNVSGIDEAMIVFGMSKRHISCYEGIERVINKRGRIAGIRFKNGQYISYRTYAPYELGARYGLDDTPLQAVIDFNLLGQDAPMDFDVIESLL